mgnify:CR=1 FL=1
MRTLSLADIVDKLRELEVGTVSAYQAGAWATEKFYCFERGVLKFEEPYEDLIFDLLTTLIANEDEPFRMDVNELTATIKELKSLLVKHEHPSSKETTP